MLLSVIIPTCNRNESLGACLDRLKPGVQALEPGLYEVIVSDDSKDFGAAAFLEQHYGWVRYTKGPQRGPAANRNHGAKGAKGEWLVFTDDDCLPNRDWLLAMYRAIQASPGVLTFEGATLPDRDRQHLAEECPANETGGFFWSCNCALQAHFFYQVLKGYDENFPYAAMEDVDMHWRILKAGQTPQFVPEAIVIHPWRIQQQLLTMSLRRFASTRYLLARHPERIRQFGIKYYLHAFYRGLFMRTLPLAPKLGFRGFGSRVLTDMMQLYFGAVMWLQPVKPASNL